VVDSKLISTIFTVKRVCSKQALFYWNLWVRMGTYISIVVSSSNAEILENSSAIGVRSSISLVASSLEDVDVKSQFPKCSTISHISNK
jgi:hypothetical protein